MTIIVLELKSLQCTYEYTSMDTLLNVLLYLDRQCLLHSRYCLIDMFLFWDQRYRTQCHRCRWPLSPLVLGRTSYHS